MPNTPATQQQLLAENDDLRARLVQAEETLREMRSDGVDALYVSGAGDANLFTLKDADQSFRILVEEMSEGALTMTAEGVIVYANRHFAEMLKTPLEKVIGSTLRTWIAPGSQPILQSLLEKKAGEERSGELELAGSDGARVSVHLSVSNLRIDGVPDAYCLVATDLTEHNRVEAIAASEKLAHELLAAANQSRQELLSVIEDKTQAEEALRIAEQQQRQLVENLAIKRSRLADAQRIAKIGSWEATLATMSVHWSDELHRILETDPATFHPTHRTFLDFVHPEDRARVDEDFASSLAGGAPNAIEHRFVMPDKRIKYVEERWQVLSDTQGVPIRVVGTCQDITERKRMETALQESEAEFRILAEAMPQIVWITRPDGWNIYFNQQWMDYTGLTLEESRGHGWNKPFHPDDQQRALDAWQRATETIGTYSIESRLRRADGVYRWWLVRGVPLKGATDEVLKWFGTCTDIHDLKIAELEIRDLNASLERRVAERTQQLEEANRAKSDFLANMSHELRTPLNSIIGFSEMLKDGVLGELDPKQRGFVTDILDAGTHLLSLINDILDLSKVEAGMLQLEAGAVDVPALLKASMMVVREKAAAHRVRLDTQLATALGSMLGDERKLKQIVYNLLSNAVKFTPEGGTVTLRARLCTRSEVALDAAMPGRLIALPPGEDGEFLALTVEDSGVGIAEQDLQKLYEPFVQVDSSVDRRYAGTGLGLSLVRRLAELHGGTVGVASRPGAGSRFSVWLPYRAVPEGRTAPAVPLALVIEDDDSMAELIARQLRAKGFEVMRSATAEEGLARAAKRRPQLITLDIVLPTMDGWEFLRQLKADARLADTLVVIISAAEDLNRGLALGARRVLRKPFAPEELAAALAGLVDARPQRATD